MCSEMCGETLTIRWAAQWRGGCIRSGIGIRVAMWCFSTQQGAVSRAIVRGGIWSGLARRVGRSS